MENAKKSKDSKAMWFAYAIMWIAVSAAVIAGMLITKSAWCLWAFLLTDSIKSKIECSFKEDDDDRRTKDRLGEDLK